MIKYKVIYNCANDTYSIHDGNNIYHLNNEQDISQIIVNLNNYSSIKKKYNNSFERIKQLNEILIKKNTKIHKLEKKLNKCEDRLNGLFPINAEPIKSPYRLNLRDYFSIPSIQTEKYWGVGDILKALHYYCNDDVNIMSSECVGDYQGYYYAVFKINDYLFLWRGDFGSCDVCDMISGTDIEEGYEVLINTLSEGNTLQFYNKVHAMNYLITVENSNRYNNWKNFPKEFLD